MREGKAISHIGAAQPRRVRRGIAPRVAGRSLETVSEPNESGCAAPAKQGEEGEHGVSAEKIRHASLTKPCAGRRKQPPK